MMTLLLSVSRAEGSWTALPPHRFDQMAPKAPFFEQDQFKPEEMKRLARNYYSLFEAAFERAGGQGFISVPVETPARRVNRTVGLPDHAHAISTALCSGLPPYNLDAAGVQAALLEQGWVVHWDALLLDNPQARGDYARSAILSLFCGRATTSELEEDPELEDLTGPRADRDRRLHQVDEEEIPPYVRVWELNHPGRNLANGFRITPAKPPNGTIRARGLRPSRWDPLGACCLVFPRIDTSDLALMKRGMEADRLNSELVFWRRVGAAELEAEQAFLGARPLLIARRMLDQSGRSAGPGRATEELTLAKAVKANDTVYRRNLAGYQAIDEEVDRQADRRIEELMLVSLLRGTRRDASQLREMAERITAHLPLGSHGARALATAIASAPTDIPATLRAWADALATRSDEETLAEGERVRQALETRLKAAVARPGGGGLFAESAH